MQKNSLKALHLEEVLVEVYVDGKYFRPHAGIARAVGDQFVVQKRYAAAPRIALPLSCIHQIDDKKDCYGRVVVKVFLST